MKTWTRGASALVVIAAVAACGDDATASSSPEAADGESRSRDGAARSKAQPEQTEADEAAPEEPEEPQKRDEPAASEADPVEGEEQAALPVPETFLADAGDGWKTLITGRWELAPGTEGYYCARFTLPQTVYVKQFKALAPPGTHHTLLTIADETDHVPDGVGKCGENENGPRNILGTGVGPSELAMPDGVGMELKAGEQLLLNLHLFNVSDEPMTGLSGSLVQVAAKVDIEQIAEEALAGPVMLDIPVGGPTVQKGECTISHDSTIFAVGPHMHQIGVHLKAVAHSSIMGEIVMHDAAYDFDLQTVHYLSEEIPMKAGDKVSVECTYMNTTEAPVKFGNSSLSEMCFAGLFRYPAGQKNYVCPR